MGYKQQRKHEETKMRIKKLESDETYPITALLIDGVTATRRLEHHMLESIGIRTELADGPQEAMQILSTGVNFDFIFVDSDLLIISGPQLVRQIRAIGTQSRVVGMVDNFDNHNVQMFEEARVDATITKPLTRESFHYIIGILGGLDGII